MLFPLVHFDSITIDEANRLLIEWKHANGPINRPMNGSVVSGGGDTAHALFNEGHPVACVVTSTLICPNVAGHPELNRGNTCELSRLVAARPDLCRVALRLWREFVWSPMRDKFPNAISYRDADRHTGNTYRFDGWEVIGKSRSGTDRRTGRPGLKKVIWKWPRSPAADAARQ